MSALFAFILFLHGALHLLGFTHAFGIGAMAQLDRHISKPIGILWFIAAILFVSTSISLITDVDHWWMLAIISVIFSQLLIVFHWKDAGFGTITNLLIIIPSLLTFGNVQFEKGYREDIQQYLTQSNPTEPNDSIKESDLAKLPESVQAYLRYAGVVNKPKIKNMHVVFEGQMRSRDRDYFSFTSDQYTFFEEPTRLFFMKASMFGITVPGYHQYVQSNASMDIRLFGIFTIVHHANGVMNKTETVTFFNDMCLLAPGTLIDDRIQWQEIDDQTIAATFTTNDIAVSAVLYFNDEGQLINFISNDRTDVSDMKTYPFSTPVNEYQAIHDQNVISKGEAIWHYPEGTFTYGKFSLQKIEYNISTSE